MENGFDEFVADKKLENGDIICAEYYCSIKTISEENNVAKNKDDKVISPTGFFTFKSNEKCLEVEKSNLECNGKTKILKESNCTFSYDKINGTLTIVEINEFENLKYTYVLSEIYVKSISK